MWFVCWLLYSLLSDYCFLNVCSSYLFYVLCFFSSFVSFAFSFVCSFILCIFFLMFVVVAFLPPGGNPVTVNRYHIPYRIWAKAGCHCTFSKGSAVLMRQLLRPRCSACSVNNMLQALSLWLLCRWGLVRRDVQQHVIYRLGGVSGVLRNVGTPPADYTASRLRRQFLVL